MPSSSRKHWRSKERPCSERRVRPGRLAYFSTASSATRAALPSYRSSRRRRLHSPLMYFEMTPLLREYTDTPLAAGCGTVALKRTTQKTVNAYLHQSRSRSPLPRGPPAPCSSASTRGSGSSGQSGSVRGQAAGFAARVAYFLAKLNVIHPFREGGGRTHLAFKALLADPADP